MINDNNSSEIILTAILLCFIAVTAVRYFNLESWHAQRCLEAPVVGVGSGGRGTWDIPWESLT